MPLWRLRTALRPFGVIGPKTGFKRTTQVRVNVVDVLLQLTIVLWSTDHMTPGHSLLIKVALDPLNPITTETRTHRTAAHTQRLTCCPGPSEREVSQSAIWPTEGGTKPSHRHHRNFWFRLEPSDGPKILICRWSTCCVPISPGKPKYCSAKLVMETPPF